MSTETQVRQAKSPQEALLVIARALDRIEATPAPASGWDADLWTPPRDRLYDDDEAHAEAQRRSLALKGYPDSEIEKRYPAVEVIADDDSTDVVFHTSPEKQAARSEFEKLHLGLAGTFGEDEDWNHAYAVGGPMWLYIADRDFVMTLPDQIKQALVQDVEEDDPQQAHEMSRDILKAACETGPGSPAMQVADGNVG